MTKKDVLVWQILEVYDQLSEKIQKRFVDHFDILLEMANDYKRYLNYAINLSEEDFVQFFISKEKVFPVLGKKPSREESIARIIENLSCLTDEEIRYLHYQSYRLSTNNKSSSSPQDSTDV